MTFLDCRRASGLASGPEDGDALAIGLRGEKMRRATYAELEAVPGNKVAEFIRGTLYVMPRPAA